MITIDQPALNQSIARWNSFVAGKIDMLQIAGQGCVKVEAGRLVQTLIKVTPPEDRTKTATTISDKVWKVFGLLEEGHPGRSFTDYEPGGKAGHGDVRWYAFQSDAIYGVAKDQDLSGAGASEYYAAYFQNRSVQALGNGSAYVQGRRGRQAVFIWKKIISNSARVRELAARLARHVGRLKAGWLVAWKDLGSPGGTYAPPQWVTRHESGALGYSINGLGDPRFPQFTLENHAKGAGGAKMNGLVRTALDIRAAAMVKRMTFLLAHPEKVSEETA